MTSHPLYSREVGDAHGDGNAGQLGCPPQGRVLEHQHHVVVVAQQQVDGALRDYGGGSEEGERGREEKGGVLLQMPFLNGMLRPLPE